MSVLVLEGLSCDDLYDTGSFNDKQDPAIRLIYNKEIFMTERSKDTGKSGKLFTICYKFIVSYSLNYSYIFIFYYNRHV